MSKHTLHLANSRGHANHGWLDTHHTFSFANYFDRHRMQFGALRVLNDDIIAGGQGFGTHPHDNMEIVSIALKGAIEHRDSMGNTSVIREGEIQVMSAGSGIQHSEFNHNANETAEFLQIWVFPNLENVTPRYGQMKLLSEDYQNKLQQIVSPNADDEGVWIHQQAWFHMARMDAETNILYEMKKPDNGVYAFVISGSATIDGQQLNRRDGLGIEDTNSFEIRASEKSEILLMEVPMND